MPDVEERPAGHSGVLVSSPTVAESILVSHEWVSAGTVVGRYQIVEKLAAVPTDGRDKPLDDVVIESISIEQL